MELFVMSENNYPHRYGMASNEKYKGNYSPTQQKECQESGEDNTEYAYEERLMKTLTLPNKGKPRYIAA
jgi:hypothetical protein